MSFTLSIDIRENALKEYFGTEFFTTLDIADIVIKKDEEILVAIERKTIDDLKASILDGRWKEQKLRLCGNVSKERIIYLIEGNILKKTTIKGGSDTLIGATLNCMFRDKIKVYKTSNLKETVAFIKKIFSSVQKNHDIFFNDDCKDGSLVYSNCIKIRKKDNSNPQAWYKQILMNIPQISHIIADCIVSKYPTLKELFKNCNEEEIKNLTYISTNGKSRKIGPKLASKLILYLEQ